MDTQQIELIGRNWLIGELLRSGLEVARPERDHGIDLIAYADLDESGRFLARPIQLKAATLRNFGVERRQERFHELLLAYVWFVGEPARTTCHCLTYPEAEGIVTAMGWSASASWTTGGKGGRPGYGTTNPSKKLLTLLEPYLMDASRWRGRIGAAAVSDARRAAPEA